MAASFSTFFALFVAFFLVWFALVVFLSDNTIHAVFSLVGIFICVFVFLLSSAGLEFFALAYLAIYVGAVAVMFLFAIMFVDLRIEDTWIEESFEQDKLFALLILMKALLLFSTLLAAVRSLYPLKAIGAFSSFNSISHFVWGNDILGIATFFYSSYFAMFVLLSFALWALMLGAIAICVYSDTGDISPKP